MGEWDEWIQESEELMLELGDLPESAEDFVASVEERLQSITEWVEEHEHVTEKQWQALRSWQAAVGKWQH